MDYAVSQWMGTSIISFWDDLQFFGLHGGVIEKQKKLAVMDFYEIPFCSSFRTEKTTLENVLLYI